jgi:hypothetical protein
MLAKVCRTKGAIVVFVPNQQIWADVPNTGGEAVWVTVLEVDGDQIKVQRLGVDQSEWVPASRCRVR